MSIKVDFKNDLVKFYNLKVKKIVELSGGWLNEKFLIIDTSDKSYVLKELSDIKFPRDYLNVLHNTVELQSKLYEEKILVPKVVKNCNNELISIFVNGKSYFLQDYIQGYIKENNEITAFEIRDIAKNLAMLHKCLRNQSNKMFESSFLSYKTIDILSSELNNRISQINYNTPTEYKNELNLHYNIINDIKKTNILNKHEVQLIHGDFTPDNIILFDFKVSAIIDFELCRINTKLQDIGRFILSTCFSTNFFDRIKLKEFICGYSLVDKINIDDIITAIKFVWINEVNLWIQERYFRNQNSAKVNRFIYEIQWISNNWFDLESIIRKVVADE